MIPEDLNTGEYSVEEVVERLGVMDIGVKRPFHEIVSPSYTPEKLYQTIAARTGISPQRLAQIDKMMGKLTAQEYDILGRAPAKMIPDEILEERKRGVLSLLYNLPRSELNRVGELPTWQGVDYEDVAFSEILKEPANIITAFIRIRPRRLLQSMAEAGLLTGAVAKFAKKCFRENFTANRFTGTLALYLVLGDGPRRELEFLLDEGGFEMDNKEWLEVCKAHHEMAKVSRVILTQKRQLEPDELADYLYFNFSVGRDHFMDNEATEKEVQTRQRVPDDYTWPDGSRVKLEDYCKGLWTSLLRQTGKMKKPKCWEEFIETLYLKLPGGSDKKQAIDMNEVGGIRGLSAVLNRHVRGNKRFSAEIKPIRHFSEFGKWEVHAFIKYEVAKNRWLYPGELEYIILGLFMMDSVVEAFASIPGVDLGHTLTSSIGTKLSVLEMVRCAAICMNTDGKGFNENHSRNDMILIYEAFMEAVRKDDPHGYQAHADLEAAVKKYKESLIGREITIPKLWKDGVMYKFIVDHTLLSGEFTTQIVNTHWIGTSAMSGSDYLKSLGLLEWVKLFFKGDDLNAFLNSWLQAWLLLRTMEDCGYIFEPAKDHIEPNQCEHERCIVSASMYAGSKARRVGAMVAAEPQGSQGLTIHEALESANEARMSLISRGVHHVKAMVLFKATVMTYLNTSRLPRGLMVAMGVPKCSGGFGLWFDGCWYINNNKSPPEIRTDFKIKLDGKFSEFGSAGLTDKLLSKIARDRAIPVERLTPVREMMIGDSFISTLGPQAKYGNRLKSNAKTVVNIALATRYQHYNVGFSSEVIKLGMDAGNELHSKLDNPEVLGMWELVTPTDIIANTLTRSGCLNEQLYSLVEGVRPGRACLRRMISGPKPRLELEMIMALDGVAMEVQELFYRGELRVIFWDWKTKINTEVAALVQRVTLRAVALHASSLDVVCRKQIANRVKWDLICVKVAQLIWERNKLILDRICY